MEKQTPLLKMVKEEGKKYKPRNVDETIDN